MTIVALDVTIATIKMLGFILALLFAMKAFKRLNNLNIDIGGKLVRINVFSFLIPLFLIFISPIFNILYESYQIDMLQQTSYILEGLAGLLFAYAFLELYKSLQKER